MSKAADGGEAGRIEALKSLRTTLDWLGDEVHSIANEVDPVIEMTAITKAFDGSKALVAENIKDYPNARMYSNLYATPERTARLFGVGEYKDIKHKILDAYCNPIAANHVESAEAPVQETAIPASDIERVTDILPIIMHTNEDGARIFGSGCHLIGPPWVPGGGNTISMYRMAFRDNQQYASINMVPGGQGDVVCKRHPGKKIPITVNCSPPVGAELMAVGTLNPVIFPGQTDKVGMAGALQGSAIDLVKAKTVDAYAIAQSEWVMEGYVIESERVWETDQAEQLGRQGEAPLHPEWARYMGRAYRTPRAFELTAITHRADKPFYYTPHFGAIWYTISFVCASIYEMCERMAPGFVQDVAGFTGLTTWGGIVVQVKKRRRSDEGMQRNIMGSIMSVHRGLRLCVVVDEDIYIWEPEDVLWAIESRISPRRDVVVYNEYGRGQAFQPSELKTGQISVADDGLGLDATVPLDQKGQFQRAVYPVAEMDFSRWFSDEEMADLRRDQDRYFKFLARTGYA